MKRQKHSKNFTRKLEKIESIFTKSKKVNKILFNIIEDITSITKNNLALLELLGVSLKELKKTVEVFTPYREKRKVCIFGSARIKQNNLNYRLAEELAELLSKEGIMTMTGAGPGIMEAANKGAGEGQSFGLNIKLPMEQEINSYINGSNKLINYQYFFIRKLSFIQQAAGFIFLPGGIGTMDELFEILPLMKTGKISLRPIILLEKRGGQFWSKWLDFFNNQLLANDFVCSSDLKIFKRVESASQAVKIFKKFYRRFYSYQYDNQQVIIYFLGEKLKENQLKKLSQNFVGINCDKTIKQKSFTNRNHALIFKLKENAYSRLREFIDYLNTF